MSDWLTNHHFRVGHIQHSEVSAYFRRKILIHLYTTRKRRFIKRERTISTDSEESLHSCVADIRQGIAERSTWWHIKVCESVDKHILFATKLLLEMHFNFTTQYNLCALYAVCTLCIMYILCILFQLSIGLLIERVPIAGLTRAAVSCYINSINV